MEKKFIRVDEVARVLEISESHAYKLMRKLNREVEAKGDITVFQPGLHLEELLHFLTEKIQHLDGAVAFFGLGRGYHILSFQSLIGLADFYCSTLKIEICRGQSQQLALTDARPVQHLKCVVRNGLGLPTSFQ